MHNAMNLLNLAALVACLYTCGGAVCRLRHSKDEMQTKWALLYLSIFALSAWTAADIVTTGIGLRDALTCIFVGLYFLATAVSWLDGVPNLARAER
jgi:hypothetical protein